ncbi:MAG: hypothetical protein R2715_04665 [Ilumatobacteraceae bacterium]
MTETAVVWLGDSPLELTGVSVGDTLIRVDVAGPVEPPPTSTLKALLNGAFGDDIVLEVRWTLRSAVPESLPPPSTVPEPTSDELRLATARAAVGAWLAAATADGEFEVTDVALDGDTVVVDVVGPTSPPSIEPLAEDLVARLGAGTQLNVRWSQRLEVADQPAEPDQGAIASATVDGWIAEHPGLAVLRVRLDPTGAMVEVDLLGEVPPTEAALDELEARIAAALGRATEVRPWFVARSSLPATTTTTIATATSPTTPSQTGPTDPTSTATVAPEGAATTTTATTTTGP